MDSPLRILFVDTERVWRGGQEQLFSLMTGLRDRGHQVCLVAYPGAALDLKARQTGFWVVPIAIRNSYDLGAFLKLGSLLRKERFDIIHFNTPRAMVLGSLVSRWLGVPARIVSRRVNFPLQWGWLSRIKYTAGIDQIITVSYSIRDTLIASGVSPKKVSVVYEGINLADFESVEPASDFSSARKKVVGTVSHLSEEKGATHLIAAAERVCARHPDALFVVVGAGPLQDRLVRQRDALGLTEKVLFLGFKEQTLPLIKSFEIFVLPSLSEGLSSAILAAMACGLPVVSTSVGGIPELVRHGETGLLVDPANPAQLAQAVCHLLEHPSEARSLGEAGRKRVGTYFHVSAKLDQTVDIYRRLLRRKSP